MKNTILKIFLDAKIDLKKAVRLLRKNRVSNAKLARMAEGEDIFTRNKPLLQEAAKVALERNLAAKRQRCERKIAELQEKLAGDGGVMLPERA